jgi:hypothetical protein
MFNIKTISNWVAKFDISDAEADRIGAKVNSYEEFVQVWENEDWWTDANNPE